jgi:hypothetical protein
MQEGHGVTMIETGSLLDSRQFVKKLARHNAHVASRNRYISAIYAYNNKITELPAPWLCALPHLCHLDFDYNDITELPREIGQWLPQLITLRVIHNNLRTLPRSLGQCTQLVTLHCSYNLLDHLPPTLAGLSALNSLQLFSNPLPGGFAVNEFDAEGHGAQSVLRAIGEYFTYREARVSTICLLVLARLRKTHALSCINNVLEYVLAPMLYETREDDDAWRPALARKNGE